jgi:hypothetical protein
LVFFGFRRHYTCQILHHYGYQFNHILIIAVFGILLRTVVI